MTLQARLERVIGWLHTIAWRRGWADPGRVPLLIHWLREWEDRRCYLVPLSLARYGLLEIDGELAGYDIRAKALDAKTITVLLPGEIYWQGDPPVGTFRIRRFDYSRASWLVYR